MGFYSITILIVISCLQFEAETETQIVANGKKYVGYVLFRKNGFTDITYLILKPKSKVDQWTVLKGAIQSAESALEAAGRILQQVTNYTREDLVNMELDDLLIRPDNSTTYLVAYFTRITKNMTLSSEYEDFKWLPLEKACKYIDKISADALLEANKFLRIVGF